MTTPWLDDGDIQILSGDCIEVMRGMPDASVDAIVTDPPYALGFMGKEWDRIGDTGRGARARTERADEVTPRGTGHVDGTSGPYLAAGVDSLRSAGQPFEAWCESWGREAIRVLKPGGHLIAFGGTRTFHRLTSGLEDAGFEIRDCLPWLYGSGFPKSLDVSKAIDKAAGAEREVVGVVKKLDSYGVANDVFGGGPDHGGTMKITAPATDAAREWEGWGTALKPGWEPAVLARRPLEGTVARNVTTHGTGGINIDACRIGSDVIVTRGGKQGGNAFGDWANVINEPHVGRWPANVLLDEGAARMLDEQAAGSPSRFYYTAKASSADRNNGHGPTNTHPTVKPTDLMRWLIRLVTPPGGVILDPFAGSGSTGVAARAEGHRAILIERDPEYLQIIAGRLAQQSLLGGAA